MTRRTTIGFLAAPLVVAFIVAVVTPSEGGSIGNQLLAKVMIFVVWYCGAAALTAALAVPAYAMLYRLNFVRWWSALAVGLAVGFIATFIVASPSAPVLQGKVPFCIIGGLAAIIACLIWKPARDR
jgi:uncharacterized membrane protein YeiH